jgi:hypothetical protein
MHKLSWRSCLGALYFPHSTKVMSEVVSWTGEYNYFLYYEKFTYDYVHPPRYWRFELAPRGFVLVGYR